MLKRPVHFDHFDAPMILAMGLPGSGLPFHRHRQNFIDVLRGEKEWWVFSAYEAALGLAIIHGSL